MNFQIMELVHCKFRNMVINLKKNVPYSLASSCCVESVVRLKNDYGIIVINRNEILMLTNFQRPRQANYHSIGN